jgi:hypothetical protein
MSGINKDRRLAKQEELSAALDAAPSDAVPGDSPQAGLLRLARSGGFESLVARARPVEPPKMVTPEEREKALRATGQWPEEKPSPAVPQEAAPAAPPARPMTPQEEYRAEKCRWVPLHERPPPRPTRPYGQAITEYDWLTGETIGDGYMHPDDEWY